MKARDYLLITNQVLGSNSKVHQTALHKPLIGYWSMMMLLTIPLVKLVFEINSSFNENAVFHAHKNISETTRNFPVEL